MTTRNDLGNAAIVPNSEAGGVKLGAARESLKTIWGEPVQIDISGGVEKWEYEDITFWIESGKVDQIGLSNCYGGRTSEGIGLGHTRNEVEKVYGSLAWDGLWFRECEPFGLGFDFEPDLTGEQFVAMIYVFTE
jgi:hypothetical protein